MGSRPQSAIVFYFLLKLSSYTCILMYLVYELISELDIITLSSADRSVFLLFPPFPTV
jgi:hypothetical protein